MKRFLFKGRDINYNNVIVGNGIIEDDNGRMSIHTTIGWVEVIPSTVGVATGRFYDDGLPVFSGDTVEIEGMIQKFRIFYDTRSQRFMVKGLSNNLICEMNTVIDLGMSNANKNRREMDDNDTLKFQEFIRDKNMRKVELSNEVIVRMDDGTIIFSDKI